MVEETGVPGENHRPVASHWQTLSHNVVHLTLTRFELTTSVVIGTNCIGSCKSNYHMITARRPQKECVPRTKSTKFQFTNFLFF
jgi:hypothetical protein